MYRTAEEIAEELHVTRRTVYEWLRSGRLRGARAGRGWRIRPEDVETFLQADGPGGATPNGTSPPVAKVDEPERVLSLQEILALSPEERQKRNEAAREMLRSWVEEGDEEEQRETWEELKKALDEDRLSYRKLFP